jgi:hypothetical protein
VLSGVVLVLGWIALPAIWWFGFRGRGEDGSLGREDLVGEADDHGAVPDGARDPLRRA